jgi:membrane protein DedA with SNARE-associated domain
LIVAAKIGYLGGPRLGRAVSIAMWLVFGYFVLNVIGNLTSQSHVEKMIFTPVAIVISVLAFRLAIEK